MSMAIQSAANRQQLYETVQPAARTSLGAGRTSGNVSGHAVYEQMGAISKGLEQGIQNAGTMNSLLSTAEGSLSAIAGNLQRIRDLSLQASNATLSQDERSLLHNEINQLADTIGSISSSSMFNGIKLLNGTFTDRNTAATAYGTGQKITLGDFSLTGLGLVGNGSQLSNPAVIGNALDLVTAARSGIGTISERLGSSMNANAIANINIAASRNRIAYTDTVRASSEASRINLANQYRLMLQQNAVTKARNQVNILL